MPWLNLASALRGKALHVGIALWFLAGVKRSSTVDINLSRLAISPSSARRGLLELERAGLVSVERGSGRRPRVTILVEQEP